MNREQKRAETTRKPSGATIAIIAEDEVAGRRVAASLGSHAAHVVASHTASGELSADVEDVDVVVVCCDQFSAKQVALLRRLKRRRASVPVVVVAKSIRRSVLADGLAAGMDACVLEPDVDMCLVPAVDGARHGQLSLPRELSFAVAQPVLSVREKQILALVVMGFSNAEIAQKLFVAESTVKSHLSSAFSRLGVRSRHQAAAIILDPESGFGPGILQISGDERRRGPA